MKRMRRQYKELKTKFQGMREAYIQEKGSLLHCGNIIQSRKRIRTETESANSHWFLEQSGLEATCFLWCLKFSVGVFHRGQRPLSTEAPSRALVDLKNVWVGLQEIEAVINKETAWKKKSDCYWRHLLVVKWIIRPGTIIYSLAFSTQRTCIGPLSRQGGGQTHYIQRANISINSDSWGPDSNLIHVYSEANPTRL